MSVMTTTLQGAVLLGLHFALILAAAPIACGSEPELDLPPALEWTVESEHTDLWLFEADQSGGQLSQDAQVVLRNTGGGRLRIDTVRWLGGHPHMAMHEEGVITSWPHELASGKTLAMRVRYAPVPGELSSGEATLEVKYAGGQLTLRFAVRPKEAQACLDTSELKFVNPSPSSATRCLRLRNCGDQPFTIGATFVAPVSAFWQVSKAPAVGTVVPVSSGPRSGADGLEYCVRLSGAQPGDLLEGSLLMDMDIPSRKRIKVPLKVKWLINNNFVLACDGPAPGGRFNLQDLNEGAEATCRLQNVGQVPFKVSSFAIEAYDADHKEEVLAGFEVRAENQNSGGALQAPFAFDVGSQRSFVVRSLRPAAAQIRNAELVIRFVHGMVPDTLRIPVAAGDCGRPTAVLAGSAHGLWLSGAAGIDVEAQLSVANQGCAALHVLAACVVSAVAPLTSSPCAAASVNGPWRLHGGDMSAGLPAWGVHTLPLRFSAPGLGSADAEAQLRVIYCDGLWQQGACAGELRTLAAALRGRRDAVDAPAAPTLEASGLKVGQPLQVVAKGVEAGQSGDFQWRVQQRPEGAAAFISPQFEVDLPPWTTFVPDVAGTWVVSGSARVWASGSTEWSASAPALLSLQVAP